jgi:DNA-binding transcriptional LysR family regulator
LEQARGTGVFRPGQCYCRFCNTIATMDFDVAGLRAFIEIAERLHFGEASRALGVSASTLTRTIQALEAAAGTRLLNRSTHHVALTGAGDALLPSARRIVAECDWAGRQLGRRGGGASSFVVGCLGGALYEALPSRIRAARRKFPSLGVRLLELSERGITERVLDGTVDVGFLYFPPADTALEHRVVSRRPQVVAMSPEHRFAGRASLQLSDLAGETLILPDHQAAPRLHRWYRTFLEGDGRRPLDFVEASQVQAALGLCAAREGLCVLAEHLQRIRGGDVRYVPLRGAPATELAAIWRIDAPMRHVAQFVATW